MLFKHPEVLYALFLLIIPVLVHLFRLRKFKPEKFTNVRFLKKAISETRKSSQLKKWLVLFIRLLLLACIILAFAQPYLPPVAGEVKPQETVIYLDNSYSMQSKGTNGILLKRAVQDLLESLPPSGDFSFFTNDAEYKNISAESLKNELRKLDYSIPDLSWNSVALKAQNLFSEADKQKDFIAISDFQQQPKETEEIELPGVSLFAVPLKPESISNFSLDSIFLSESNIEQSQLTVEISSSGEVPEELPVALYNGSALLAKKTVNFENGEASTTFALAEPAVAEGRIVIEDAGLEFDNEIFFSINEAEILQVVAIGSGNNSFLQRIFRSPEFEFLSFGENNINFSELSEADLLILNEPEKIPPSLANTIQDLLQDGLYMTLIPSENANLNSYNSFFRSLGIGGFEEKLEQEISVTEIAFGHPLYEAVFNEEVQNFEYPKAQSFYPTRTAKNGILSYENGQPFLFNEGNAFIFTAPLSAANSNFQNSALIVPTFYNMGTLAVSRPELYSILGEEQNITVQTELGQDEILKLSSGEKSFIPQQQNFRNKVQLNLNDFPEEPGHYQILKGSESLGTLAFNISRLESDLNYRDLPESVVFKNIPEVFSQIGERNEVNGLWKWFLIFALFFLLCELLILKFLK